MTFFSKPGRNTAVTASAQSAGTAFTEAVLTATSDTEHGWRKTGKYRKITKSQIESWCNAHEADKSTSTHLHSALRELLECFGQGLDLLSRTQRLCYDQQHKPLLILNSCKLCNLCVFWGICVNSAKEIRWFQGNTWHPPGRLGMGRGMRLLASPIRGLHKIFQCPALQTHVFTPFTSAKAGGEAIIRL